MSLRDLLMRRQGLAAPPVPCSPTPQGVDKAIEKQSGSLGSLSSPANVKNRVHQQMELDDLYRTFIVVRRDTTYRALTAQRNHMVEPSGQVEHHKKHAGPAHEVETLLAALGDAGRDLGLDLAHHLRERLVSLSRQVRAELVAVIDDAFEMAPDLTTARRQAHRLLSDAKVLEAAKAVWPAYPDPPPQQ